MANTLTLNYNYLKNIIDSYHGSQQLHRVNCFVKNFVVTDGIMGFCNAGEAHWVYDVVASYVYKLTQINDSFFVVNIKVDSKQRCIFNTLNEEEGERKAQIKQKIPFTDLPVGEYEFYLIYNGEYYVMMCKGEY